MIDPDARFDQLIGFVLGPRPEDLPRVTHTEALAAAVKALQTRGGAAGWPQVEQLIADIGLQKRYGAGFEDVYPDLALLARYGEQGVPGLLNVIALACVEVGKGE